MLWLINLADLFENLSAIYYAIYSTFIILNPTGF